MITEIALPFLIFITNPAGTPLDHGYPVSVYQKFVEKGERQPREYATLEACSKRLGELQELHQQRSNNEGLMPEARMVYAQRGASMKCLTADAKAPARTRGVPTQPDYVWRIGRINIYNQFEGLSLDLRQHKTSEECEKAYGETVRKYRAALSAQGLSEKDVTHKSHAMQSEYQCYRVATKQPPPLYWLTR